MKTNRSSQANGGYGKGGAEKTGRAGLVFLLWGFPEMGIP